MTFRMNESLVDNLKENLPTFDAVASLMRVIFVLIMFQKI